MLGRLGDVWRLAWGLLYWNLRKAWFRSRGDSARAPCQHPSDSGRAMETGCEALSGWSRPEAFRFMCPLLATGPSGRCVCSVAAKDVRPFWGRAAAFYFGGALALYLTGVLAVFAALRGVGYRVPLHGVAWPPSWHRVREARADYFYRQALRAYGTGDVRESYLALSKVYALDPGNVGASRLLAQFTQIANPTFSDSIYERLLRTPNADRLETGREWFRALLERGDFAGLARVSSLMLTQGEPDAPAWTQGLLFAAEMGQGAEVDALLSRRPALPSEALRVLALSRTLRATDARSDSAAVELFLGGARTAFEAYYGLRELMELGRAGDVLTLLDGPLGALLAPYEREALRLDAYAALGWTSLEEAEIGRLLERETAASPVALVSAHLIRHPSASVAASFFRILASRPLPDSTAAIGAHMAALCAAASNGLEDAATSEARSLSRIVGGSFAPTSRVMDFFHSRDPSRSPSAFLPAFPQMSLEVDYALFERYPGTLATPAGAREDPS